MAYEYLKSQDPDKEDTELGPSSTLLTQKGSSSPTTVGMGGSTFTQTSNPTQKFAGAGAYLNANKGAGGSLANSIVGNLNQEQGQIKNDVESQYNTFAGQVNQGTNKINDDYAKEAERNALGILADTSKKDQILGGLTGAYKGPTTYTPTYGSQVTNFENKVNSLKTAPGVQTYLQSKGQSLGKAGLNSALIGNQLNSYQNNLSPYVSDLSTKAGLEVEKAKKESLANAEKLNQQLSTGLQAYKTEAQKNLENQKAKYENENKILQEALAQGPTGLERLPEEYLTKLGFKKEDISKIRRASEIGNQGFDFAKEGGFKPPPSLNLTVDNTIESDKRAQANALASLLGQAPIFAEAETIKPQMPEYNTKAVVDKVRQNALNKIKQDATKDFQDAYYKNIGQYSGQGWAPTQGQRADSDVKAFVEKYLTSDKAPSIDEINRQWQFGANPNAWGGAGVKILQALNNARDYYRGI